VDIGTINNLDYVILLCERMAKMRKFYVNVMKFPLEMDRPNWVSFRVGSGLLTLRPRGPGLSWHMIQQSTAQRASSSHSACPHLP
jgi:hypothetical protein